MTKVSGNTKQNTKKLRFTLLAVFFNYIKNSIDPDFKNPCDNQALKRLFRAGKNIQFKILEKDVVDEIIFRTENQRNRIMLELMARGCMRIGEVLNLTPMDIEDRKVIVQSPKIGRPSEAVFLPQKVIDRMKKYIRDKGIRYDCKIFPITYAGARLVVKKADEILDIQVRPHDLRRHAATYASRSGTPLEIVSKILLRHSNLATTQKYLGKISDSEAIQWIDHLHG
ncbi:MAG: site-specific integrase [Deltaproteobacteria bacterium]|nr:site-specific integrase [Deltaproteobacteria bacterium]